MKVNLDMDKFSWEAQMAMESDTVEPPPSWSCTVVNNHLLKFYNDRLLPMFGGNKIPINLCLKDLRTPNFRKTIYPEYKENRKGKPRPMHELIVQDYLSRKYQNHSDFKISLASGQEADDLLGIFSTEDPENTLTIHTDNDLRMLLGYHEEVKTWNQKYQRIPYYVKDPGVMYLEQFNISPKKKKISAKGVFATGLKCFYHKLLAGDSSDGCNFIVGWGAKTAYEALQHANDERELCSIVKMEYQKIYGDKWQEVLTLAGRVLWVRRKWNEMWEIPY